MNATDLLTKLRTVTATANIHDPMQIANQLEAVGCECNSALHQVAAMVVRKLIHEVRVQQEALNEIERLVQRSRFSMP